MMSQHERAESGLTLAVPPEMVEQIAERAAAIVAERQTVQAGGSEWIRGAQAIADYIDSPRSRVYSLAGTTPIRIPVSRDGSAYIARRSELDQWLEDGGGKRP